MLPHLALLSVLLAPQERATAARQAEGIVRDAYTGRPLAGVRLGFWTEDLYGPSMLVAEQTTGDDGRFGLELPPDAEKLVLERAGYRRTELGSGDEEIALFPLGPTLEWRVLDLEGRPLAGARLLSRQSCRHARPALEVASDAEGWLRTAEPPPVSDGGDLELALAGFDAWGKIDVLDAWEWHELYLPARATYVLRCLDPEGRAVPAGSLRYDSEEGGYPLAPDAQGLIHIERLFADRAGLLFWREPQGNEFVLELDDLPSGGPWLLRFGEPPPSASAVLRIPDVAAHLAPEGGALRVSALHEQGWLIDRPGEHHLPPGRVRLRVGSPFSGVAEELVVLELRAGATLLAPIQPKPEPRLRLLLPVDAERILIQAGEHSVRLQPPEDPPTELETPVPPNRRVIVVVQGRSTHRAVLDPWTELLTADLSGEATLLPGSEGPPAVEVPLSFRVRAPAGAELRASAIISAGPREHDDLDPDPEIVRFVLPSGAYYEISFRAEGAIPLQRAGRVGDGSPAEFGIEELVLPSARQ